MKLENPDQDLEESIQLIFSEHDGNYGYRRIHLELNKRGFHVNHKKVQRIMKKFGLKQQSLQENHASTVLIKVRLEISLKTVLNVVFTQMSVIKSYQRILQNSNVQTV